MHRLRKILGAVALASILSACTEYHAGGEYENPYSVEEIRAMMAYHGAQAARFDKNQWKVLVKGRWIPIENARASEILASSRDKDAVVPSL